MTRFIFITGGVVSSLGKGLGSAALGALLQARGFKVRLCKMDPYLNSVGIFLPSYIMTIGCCLKTLNFRFSASMQKQSSYIFSRYPGPKAE